MVNLAETIEEMLMTVVKVVLTSLGVFLLFVIITSSAKAAYEQSAFESVERLRSAIDEVCLKDIEDEDSAIEFKINLPQNILLQSIFDKPVLGAATESFIGKVTIKQVNEPNYILYYESFPVGEAIGWELYHDFDYRIITQIDGGESIDADKIKEIIGEKKDKFKEKYPQNKLDGVLVNNIILSDIDASTGEVFTKPIGEWEDEKFEFKQGLLPPLNETWIKYQSCGNNALCLKTEKGVYSFSLKKYCENIGVDYIQLVSKDTLEKARYSDFYLASPCEINIKVFVDDCTTNKWDSNFIEIVKKVGGCQRTLTYPIFGYEDGNLKKIGEHTTCIDQLNIEEGKEAEKSVTVTYPKSGEVLEAGKTYTITWSSSGIDDFCISLWKGGKRDYQLACNIKGNSYSWAIPSYMQGSDYRIQVCEDVLTGCGEEDFSNSFEITEIELKNGKEVEGGWYCCNAPESGTCYITEADKTITIEAIDEKNRIDLSKNGESFSCEPLGGIEHNYKCTGTPPPQCQRIWEQGKYERRFGDCPQKCRALGGDSANFEAAPTSVSKCVRVVFDKKNGFCYTDNPKKDWLVWVNALVGPSIIVNQVAYTLVLTSLMPVTEYTDYLGDNTYVLEGGVEPPSWIWETLKPTENWVWP